MNVIGATSDEIVKALTPGDDPFSSDERDLVNEINNTFWPPWLDMRRSLQYLIQPAQSDTVITVT